MNENDSKISSDKLFTDHFGQMNNIVSMCPRLSVHLVFSSLEIQTNYMCIKLL